MNNKFLKVTDDQGDKVLIPINQIILIREYENNRAFVEFRYWNQKNKHMVMGFNTLETFNQVSLQLAFLNSSIEHDSLDYVVE